MITGVHHVCVKCRPEDLEKVQKFYGELLGLPLVRSWGEPNVEGLMYGAGTSLIEIFPNAEEDLPQGAIRHFALATDDVDSIVETVRQGWLCRDDGAGRYRNYVEAIPSGTDRIHHRTGGRRNRTVL